MTTQTLFDQTPAAGLTPRPAAVTHRPLVIALDVAIGTTGVAGEGWTDHVHATATTLHGRFQQQLDGIVSFIRNADKVVIEGAAFSKARLQGMDQLAAMRWMVRHELWRRGIPYAIVPPDNRTIYATGKARWKDEETGTRLTTTQVKGMVRDAVRDRYGVDCTGRWRYDEADAYVLLAMAYDHLGAPLAEVPQTHSRAVAGCDWSEFTPAVAS
ncbi:hypothetical protein STAN_1831 [Streptomyces sp. CBMAI 2042]|uniref:hypothetical protein n=1 Tax=Streptomyces sp. CBMAI 2042 TaxID=2305222 RepID=UPI000F1F2299|nr:hypothetical protein [Streptomyces sp. CBMAI 2042]RLV66310.1 hypothetical protein STAN_1831 [Streptomyces sp. CBMAI 2042]